MRRALLVVALLMTGCGSSGPATHSVSGTIKIKGGAPLGKGIVQFQSEKFTGSGGLSSDGKYTLSGTSEGSGVPEGTYKVVLLSTETGGNYGDPNPKPTATIDPKYADRATTPLEVKVPGGAYDFEVEPAPPGKK